MKDYRRCFSLYCFYYFLFSVGLFFTGCVATDALYHPDKKYAPAQLKQDFNVLWQTFQQNHPSLYWYNSKDTIDYYFKELHNKLTDSLTEPAFRNQLAIAVEKIKCGHTNVQLSKAFGRYITTHKDSMRFPLEMKTWDGDSLVITKNAFQKDTQLVRGTVIKSIDGMSVNELIVAMCASISADGFNNNLKYQLISNNFPAYYRFTFGLKDYYEIEYVSADGIARKTQIANYNTQKVLTGNQNILTTYLKYSKRELRLYALHRSRSIIIDTTRQMAYMQLNTFSKSRLHAFFRKSFRLLRKENIRNLVIELRENGGGNINNSTTLTKYIVDHPFHVADTVAAVSFSYPYPKQVKNGFWYKIEHLLMSPQKQGDGRYHFTQLEKKLYKPRKHNHYEGNVFIITGGYTFSASILFLHQVKGQKNVTIIGEETGGAAYGNTAINIADVVLPNTGIRVRLPLYRLVLDKNLPHDGRGIMPDVYVPPGSVYLKNNIDPKMEKVKEVIGKKK